MTKRILLKKEKMTSQTKTSSHINSLYNTSQIKKFLEQKVETTYNVSSKTQPPLKFQITAKKQLRLRPLINTYYDQDDS